MTGKTMSDAAYTEAVLHMAHVALASATESATEHEGPSDVLRGMSQVVMLAGSGVWDGALAQYDGLVEGRSKHSLRRWEERALWMVREMIRQAAVDSDDVVLTSVSYCIAAFADGATEPGRGWLEHARANAVK